MRAYIGNNKNKLPMNAIALTVVDNAVIGKSLKMLVITIGINPQDKTGDLRILSVYDYLRK